MPKGEVLIRPPPKVTVRFLAEMMKQSYVGKSEIIDAHRAGEIAVNLTGRSNKCGVINPRFDKQHKDPASIPSVLFHYTDNSRRHCTRKKQDKKHPGGNIWDSFF